MVDSNKIDRGLNYLLLLVIALIPFGHLFDINIFVYFKKVNIHPIDIIILLISIITIIILRKRLIKDKRLIFFILYEVFVSILNLSRYSLTDIIFGSIYFLKLFSYIIFFYYLIYLCRENVRNLKIYLLIVGVLSAIFGWLQYMFFPNFKFLEIYGYDAHLLRLSGTFLDPNFMGVLIVVVFFVLLSNFKSIKYWFKYIFLIFLYITLLFTYSRSSYLAFLSALFLIYRKNIPKLFLIVIMFIFCLLLLPRSAGEGLKIERKTSILKRVDFNLNTLPLVYSNPLFGVGYNNLCIERYKYSSYFKNTNVNAHSCTGADASLLTILVTFGVVGFILITESIINLYKKLNNVNRSLFILFFTIIFIHSLFVNSIFNSWVMIYYFIFLSTIYTSNRDKLN